jgi:hypothetical protein
MEVITGERLLGEVISCKPQRGFFFLQIESGESYFLHAKNIRGQIVPQPHDLFTFLVRDSTKIPGKTEAYDALRIKRADGLPLNTPAPAVKPIEPTESNGGVL